MFMVAFACSSLMDVAMPRLLRTRERDCRLLEEQARGSRHWVSVEVPGDLWFVVECAVATERTGLNLEVKRHITADFWEARSIYARTACEWAQLFVYVRAPSSLVKGHTFEPVVEVNQVGATDTLLFRFQSGLMVFVSEGKVTADAPLDVVRKVFPV